jgi:hypothetical protein
LYLAFVGLPMVGVVAVLKLGEQLRAPPPVKGRWSMEIQGHIRPALECQAAQSGKERSLLEIQQSGSQLGLVVAAAGAGEPVAFRGEIDGKEVKARASMPEGAGPNAPDEAFLSAGLETSQPERLVGQLELPECPSPVQVPFRATKEGTKKP